MLSTFLVSLLATAIPAEPSNGIVVIQSGRVETIADGTLKHGVVLIENGVIRTVGEDLPIERGLPVIDLGDWVVTPGFINCATRVGLQSTGSSESTPERFTTPELYAGLDIWGEVLETGVTTLGLYPPGTGIPGQAIAVQPQGSTVEEMLVVEGSYLLANMQTTSGAKKMISKGFDQSDSHQEKVDKAREKWTKEQEKKKKKKSKSKKSKKDKDDKEKDKAASLAADKDSKKDSKGDDEDEFVAPEAKEDVQPFLDLRAGTLKALIRMRRSSDYLHFLDAIDDEEFHWDLWFPVGRETDLYEVRHKVAESGSRVTMNARLTMKPNTLRSINLPSEYAKAGIPIALLPSRDSITAFREWRHDVGQLVRAGLDRDTALRAMTLEPAAQLGVDDQLGSVEAGKRANLLFFDGDPLEPATKLRAVMIDGEVVYGDLGQ